MAPIVLFLNGFTKGDWGEAFIVALSVAVETAPEMLPIVSGVYIVRRSVSF